MRNTTFKVNPIIGLLVATGVLLVSKPAYADWGQGIDALIGGSFIIIAIFVVSITLMTLARRLRESSLSTNVQFALAFIIMALGVLLLVSGIVFIFLLTHSGSLGTEILFPGIIGGLGICLIVPGFKIMKDQLARERTADQR